jgi:hypothetical protein
MWRYPLLGLRSLRHLFAALARSLERTLSPSHRRETATSK